MNIEIFKRDEVVLKKSRSDVVQRRWCFSIRFLKTQQNILKPSSPLEASSMSFNCATKHVLVTKTHLMELELESKHVAEGLMFTHVRFDEGDEELILVRATLIHF